MGQLTSAWLVGEDLNYTYTYDTAGNLLKVQANGAYHDWNDYTNTYTYGNNSWKDLLTKFNNQAIAYEGQTYNPSTGGVSGTPVSGNPISYFNGTRWAMDWAEGRNLVEAETSTDTTDTGLSFAYDASGLRTEKTVVTKTYEYEMVHTHDYTATVIEPTCTEGGYTLHECDCGDSYQDNETDPLGHDYEKISQDGYYTYYRCTRCDVRRREPLITIPVTPEPPLEQYGSSEEENQVAATPKSNSSERQLLSTVTEEHSYIYAGGMLLRETITSGNTTETLDFRYDNVGYPYALIYNNGSTTVTYYYITNLQGDVMYLVDSNGNQVAAYTYDPYGKILSATGTMAEINPLRYRGYYYDSETGFYYLQSRYYDPNTCRFINADSYASTGQSYLGYNMFAYCNNDPVNNADPTGEFLIGLVAMIVISAACAVSLSGCSPQPTSDVGAAQPYVAMPGSDDPMSPNCYAYAIGSPINEQPGGASGRTPTKWNDVNDVGESVEADLIAKGYTVREISGPNEKVYDDEFKIALRVGTQPYAFNPYTGQLYYDYHFMRRQTLDNGQKSTDMVDHRFFGMLE